MTGRSRQARQQIHKLTQAGMVVLHDVQHGTAQIVGSLTQKSDQVGVLPGFVSGQTRNPERGALLGARMLALAFKNQDFEVRQTGVVGSKALRLLKQGPGQVVFATVSMNGALPLHGGDGQRFVGRGHGAFQQAFFLERIVQTVVAVEQAIQRGLGALVKPRPVGEQPFQQFGGVLGSTIAHPGVRHMGQLVLIQVRKGQRRPRLCGRIVQHMQQHAEFGHVPFQTFSRATALLVFLAGTAQARLVALGLGDGARPVTIAGQRRLVPDEPGKLREKSAPERRIIWQLTE